MKSNDEMGELATSFNRMADTLQQSFASMWSELQTRRHTEQQLRIAAAAFESQEGMMITDANGVMVRVNQAFTRLTGYSAEEAIGQTPALFKSGRHDAAYYQRMWTALKNDGHWQGEIWNRRKNGKVYAEMLTISSVVAPDGRVSGS